MRDKIKEVKLRQNLVDENNSFNGQEMEYEGCDNKHNHEATKGYLGSPVVRLVEFGKVA